MSFAGIVSGQYHAQTVFVSGMDVDSGRMAARARCPAHPFHTGAAARPPQGHARGQWPIGSRQRHMTRFVFFCIALWLPAIGQCQFSIWIISN